jgi:tRNA G18 (ribose-2'-O)-methylase SpoU
MKRGFFAIGIERNKTRINLGTLWRSAYLYEAAFVFTVGVRYDPSKDCGHADSFKTHRSIPLMHFENAEQLIESLPYSCPLIGLELDDRSQCISTLKHPEQACYVLGAEDHGLTKDMSGRCHQLVQLPGRFSMNVACAGTVVMHDRWTKFELKKVSR